MPSLIQTRSTIAFLLASNFVCCCNAYHPVEGINRYSDVSAEPSVIRRALELQGKVAVAVAPSSSLEIVQAERKSNHAEERISLEVAMNVPRNIYMYWAQGNPPEIVQMAAQSWTLKNPTWNFYMVSDSTLPMYIQDETILRLLQTQQSLQFKSDLVRTNLLVEHGGVYADGDVLASVPLDEWLAPNIVSGFFAYRIQKDKRSCASWFLAAEKSHYILTKLRSKLHEKAAKLTKPQHYYEWHFTFTDLTRTDTKFKQLWDAVPKKFSIHPDPSKTEYVLAFHQLSERTSLESKFCKMGACSSIKQLIDNHRAPLYKLNRHKAVNSKGLMEIASYVVNAK